MCIDPSQYSHLRVFLCLPLSLIAYFLYQKSRLSCSPHSPPSGKLSLTTLDYSHILSSSICIYIHGYSILYIESILEVRTILVHSSLSSHAVSLHLSLFLSLSPGQVYERVPPLRAQGSQCVARLKGRAQGVHCVSGQRVLHSSPYKPITTCVADYHLCSRLTQSITHILAHEQHTHRRSMHVQHSTHESCIDGDRNGVKPVLPICVVLSRMEGYDRTWLA